MRTAYSYLRFSTLEQKSGDSLRRQIAASEQYCLTHKLKLDRTLKFRDEGVSAYEGGNKKEALGEFLRLAQRGDLIPNSVLLVESLDRLSREKPRKALRTLESIVEAGVEVITTLDGRRHTVETLDDFTGLLGSLVIMSRANEESSTKAKRLRESWDEKRKSGKPLGAICPGWLKLDKEGEKYVPIPDRAQLVKRIFKLTLSGYGKRRIARTFNEEKIEPWGIGKRKGKHFHDSYIQKILHNEAVIGIFYPHILHKKKRKNLNAPIKGYFPAIVSEDDFKRVQAMGKRATPGRTQKVSNLFTNICFDGYNPQSVMRFVDKGTKKRGNGKWRYLVSDATSLGVTGKVARIKYEEFEKMFLNDLDGEHVDLHEIFKDNPHINDGTIERLQDAMNETNIAISRITAAIEKGIEPDTVNDRMQELGAIRRKQAAELESLRDKQAEAESIEAGFEREWARMGELIDAKSIDARLAIRQHIRRFIKRIEVFPNGLGERGKEWNYYTQREDDVAYSVEYVNSVYRLFVHNSFDNLAYYEKKKEEQNENKV